MPVNPLSASWDPLDPAAPATMPDGRTETPLANRVLLDYLQLGPGRTLQLLIQQYQQLSVPPTRSYTTLRSWSSCYDWTARASAYDAIQLERAQEQDDARRKDLLERGLALEYERIDHLSDLYRKIRILTADENAFWETRVHLLKYPDGQVERVESRHFNDALVRSLRGLLADIANETGGRPLRLMTLPAPQEPARPDFKEVDNAYDLLSQEEKEQYARIQLKLFHFEN